MKNKIDFFNRIILASAYLWIKGHIETKGSGNIPDICYRVKTAGYNSIHINRFSEEEGRIVKEITMSDEFKPIKDAEISLVIMSLVVMKIWIADIPKKQRPIININDRALTLGKNQYLTHMIELKREDLE
ncbi:MAG: hypothetical protein DRN14_06145, partial [Thermoplasmata archaeon]